MALQESFGKYHFFAILNRTVLKTVRSRIPLAHRTRNLLYRSTLHIQDQHDWTIVAVAISAPPCTRSADQSCVCCNNSSARTMECLVALLLFFSYAIHISSRTTSKLVLEDWNICNPYYPLAPTKCWPYHNSRLVTHVHIMVTFPLTSQLLSVV